MHKHAQVCEKDLKRHRTIFDSGANTEVMQDRSVF